MKRTLAEFRALGWHGLAQPDICWLDCPQPASLQREHKGHLIALCWWHAEILEDGRWDGDYAGAPLPPESAASAWPWVPALAA